MCRGWHDCKFSLACMFVVNCDQHAASLCRAIVACTRCTGSNELPISRRLVRLVTRCVQSAKVGQHVLEGGALAEAQRAIPRARPRRRTIRSTCRAAFSTCCLSAPAQRSCGARRFTASVMRPMASAYSSPSCFRRRFCSHSLKACASINSS